MQTPAFVSNLHAKLAAHKNPRIAAIGAALQGRDAAMAAATAPADKLKAFTSSLGAGIKAAKATAPTPSGGGPPPAPHMQAYDAAAAGRPGQAKPGSAYRAGNFQ